MVATLQKQYYSYASYYMVDTITIFVVASHARTPIAAVI